MKARNNNIMTLDQFNEKHYGKVGTKNVMNWKKDTKISKLAL